MKINGEIIELATPITLAALLAEKGFQTKRIAVERNGEIVPKSEYETTMLQNDDVLEVVSFVGGG